MTYPSCKADFYNKTHTNEEYREILKIIANKKQDQYLSITDQGLTVVGRISRIREMIWGWLGFGDNANPIRVDSELLKFLYYGKSHNYFDELQTITFIRAIDRKIKSQEIRVGNAVQEAFAELAAEQKRKESDELVFTQNMRTRLEQYHYIHRNSLGPGLLDRLFSEKVNISSSAEFGEIWIVFAERASGASDKYSSRFPDISRIRETLHYYSLAVQLSNAPTQLYLDKLTRSFENLIKELSIQSEDINQAIGNIYSLLGERAFRLQDYAEAIHYFDKTFTYQSPRRETYCSLIECYTRVGKLDKVAECIYSMDRFQWPENDSYLNTYIEACIAVGDHFFQKNGTLTTLAYNWLSWGRTPTSVDHCRNAIRYYEKALAVAPNDHLNIEWLQNLLQAYSVIDRHEKHRKQTQTSVLDRLYHKALTLKQNNKEEDAINLLLLALECSDKNQLFSPFGMQLTGELASIIERYYQTHKDSKEACDKALQWINHTINLRGEITQFFQLDENDRIVCSNESILYSGRYIGDVIARYYFMKGEIMQYLHMRESDKLTALQSYENAMRFAPHNPFGAHALLMVDDPSNIKRSGVSYSEMIDTARNVALNWGANSQIW